MYAAGGLCGDGIGAEFWHFGIAVRLQMQTIDKVVVRVRKPCQMSCILWAQVVNQAINPPSISLYEPHSNFDSTMRAAGHTKSQLRKAFLCQGQPVLQTSGI